LGGEKCRTEISAKEWREKPGHHIPLSKLVEKDDPAIRAKSRSPRIPRKRTQKKVTDMICPQVDPHKLDKWNKLEFKHDEISKEGLNRDRHPTVHAGNVQMIENATA
jgi:hypothetical protein